MPRKNRECPKASVSSTERKEGEFFCTQVCIIFILILGCSSVQIKEDVYVAYPYEAHQQQTTGPTERVLTGSVGPSLLLMCSYTDGHKQSIRPLVHTLLNGAKLLTIFAPLISIASSMFPTWSLLEAQKVIFLIFLIFLVSDADFLIFFILFYI